MTYWNRVFVCLLFISFCTGCGCRYYYKEYATDKSRKVKIWKKSGLRDITKARYLLISFPNYEDDYKWSYTLPNDSVIIGPAADLFVVHKKNEKRLDKRFRVGEGSEFEVDGYQFEVLAVVANDFPNDSTLCHRWAFVELTRLPWYCPCQNARLKRLPSNSPSADSLRRFACDG